MNLVHRALLKVSGGKLGKQFGPMPVVELTTTGKKSGQPRTVLLTSPVQEAGKWLVVASRGGDPKHPAWYTNLVANPDVTYTVVGQAPTKAVATTVSAEERERLWPLVVKAYRGYEGYQKRTARVIPLVWLQPVAG
ncbi:deazaflavin-dependent nitroreductase [Segniliparus rugosus ATCC BAA-974]|uniref:Deazaflavin-dependent nitroreductase n=2 Tax=Segniliparus rugosus TaxID=286804 RepID=E5XLX6_SEGRC|nr:deazaflavin-dependent nitroreductase [Segniliparus rugosus ATCC BAA-974]